MKHLMSALMAPVAVAVMATALLAHGPHGSGGFGRAGGYRPSGGPRHSRNYRPVSNGPSAIRTVDHRVSSTYRPTSGSNGSTAVVKKTNGPVTATKYVKGPGNKTSVAAGQYAGTYGTKFKGGFYYKGKSHQHWA